MKIGIMTYHRAENYGSVLQTFALTIVLKKMGHSPTVIDYHSTAQDKMYKLYETPRSLKGVLRNVHSFICKKKLRTRKKRFASFLSELLTLSQEQYNEFSEMSGLNEQYDLFICGSDQIWNTACVDYSDVYLFNFVKDKQRCLSYAASIGTGGIKMEDEGKFSDYLHDFRYISVREGKAKDSLERIVDKEIDVVPDPVLLLTREDWDHLASAKNNYGDYILCYFIGDVEQMRSFAKRMHEESKLPLVFTNINLREVVIGGYHLYDTGPVEFVNLVKNAKYICTDSFHAVLFSLIYHKDFWVFTNVHEGSSRSRIDEIASKVQLTHRVLNTQRSFPDDPLCHIDFTGIDSIIREFADYGIAQLREHIEK